MHVVLGWRGSTRAFNDLRFPIGQEHGPLVLMRNDARLPGRDPVPSPVMAISQIVKIRFGDSAITCSSRYGVQM